MRTASMRASTLRVFLTALSLAVGLVLLAALATAYAGDTAAPDSPPDPNRVDVVVDLGNGNVLTRRVTFTEPTLNGLQVLQRSGLNLEIVTYSFGAAVCSIEGVGCPATNCFCNPDKFWGYLYWDGGWQGYPTGPSGSTVANGGIEGWAWGAFGDTPPAITPGNPGRRRRAAVDASATAAQRKLRQRLRQRRRDPGCDPGCRGRQPQSGPMAKHHRQLAAGLRGASSRQASRARAPPRPAS